MNTYAESLKAYLEENPIKHDSQGPNGLVNDLYWHFAERNPLINERLRSLHGELKPYFDKLTMREADDLFGVFCQLGLALEQQAFLGGLRVATQLMLDLQV